MALPSGALANEKSRHIFPAEFVATLFVGSTTWTTPRDTLKVLNNHRDF